MPKWSSTPFFDAELVINTITERSSSAELSETTTGPSGTAELACDERMLMPGLVNGHTHSVEHWARGLIKPLPLELWLQQLIRHEPRGEEGWAGPESWIKTPAAAIAVSAMHCGVEALLSGTTAIMDHLLIRDLDDLDAAVQAYKALGIRAFIVPAPHPWHTL